MQRVAHFCEGHSLTGFPATIRQELEWYPECYPESYMLSRAEFPPSLVTVVDCVLGNGTAILRQYAHMNNVDIFAIGREAMYWRNAELRA